MNPDQQFTPVVSTWTALEIAQSISEIAEIQRVDISPEELLAKLTDEQAQKFVEVENECDEDTDKLYYFVQYLLKELGFRK